MVRIMFDWQGINSKVCKVTKTKTERLKKVWSAICKYLLGNDAQGVGEDLKVSLRNATLCVKLTRHMAFDNTRTYASTERSKEFA